LTGGAGDGKAYPELAGAQMLTRLLIAVLTLVGPMPLRACTCAAGHAAHAQPHEAHPVADGHDQECGLARHEGGAHECDGPDHPAQHERGCPAADPGPVVREAVPQAATDAPAESGVAPSPVRADVPPGAGLPARPLPQRPRAPKIPLYLTLLTLRN
jgi:hypothetical protein